MRWVSAEYVKNIQSLFTAELDQVVDQDDTKSTTTEADDDDFFEFTPDDNTNGTTTTSVTTGRVGLGLPSFAEREVMLYLDDKNKDIMVLKKFLRIGKKFRKYNVVLPSSAPVERLFSTGGQILVPRRNRISDDRFETLLMLKQYRGILHHGKVNK